MNPDIRFKDDRGSPVFIHSELDDYGLTLAEFRIYCHIARRSGSGSAWPGIDSISETCCMRRQTAIKAIQSLERYGMVSVSREKGACNVYTLTKKAKWIANQSKRVNGGGVVQTGERGSNVSVNGGVRLGERGSNVSVNERFSIEGSPLKVLHEGSPIVIKAHKFFDPFGNEIPEAFRNEQFLEALTEWHKYKKERKSAYKPTGAKACLEKMIQSGDPKTAIEMIQQAMANNWLGIFQTPKASGNRNSKFGSAMRGNADRNQIQEKVSIKRL